MKYTHRRRRKGISCNPICINMPQPEWMTQTSLSNSMSHEVAVCVCVCVCVLRSLSPRVQQSDVLQIRSCLWACWIWFWCFYTAWKQWKESYGSAGVVGVLDDFSLAALMTLCRALQSYLELLPNQAVMQPERTLSVVQYTTPGVMAELSYWIALD